MPVTTRFSESLDKTYDESTPSSPPPMSLTAQAISAASGSSGTTHSSPNGSISSYSRTNSVDSLDDSHSSSSGGCGGHYRQLSNDSSVNSGSDYIPTRSIKQANKTPLNPLQFVKTGTSHLGKQATEQMKKYEEVKKLKTVEKEDPEEWQHNLDNWKSKRRQISQKTMEKAEELRKLEEEEAERQTSKKKNKTFNEMMQERSRRGSSGRKLSCWEDDDDDESVNNTSNNGWDRNNSETSKEGSDDAFENNKFSNDDCNDAPSMEKTRPDCGQESVQSPTTSASNYKVNNLNGNSNSMRKRETSNNYAAPENGSKQPQATSPNEEYTFDKAIQSYVDYAENHQRKNMERRDLAKTANNGIKYSRSDLGLDSRYANDDASDSVSTSSVNSNPEPVIERSGGTAMTIVAKIVKSSGEQRDFGFTTRSQGRGLVFVDTVASFGPADNAGLRRDDEILAVNGESVSNRSHSAIVFAIKQAVYTGCLELQTYRYNTEEALNMSQLPQSSNNIPMKKPSRVEERKAVFSREHSFERETTPERKSFVREQSPRVDIRKRRSLFEGSAPDADRKQAQVKRASDISSLRGRIASFDNLTTAETLKNYVPLERKQDTAVRDKLQSLERNERPDKRVDGVSASDRCSQFKTRLASFEKLDPVDKVERQQSEGRKQPTERKQSLKEKLAMFERQENFERSKSCDLLDVGRMQDDVFDTPKNASARVDDLAWIDAARNEDVGPPRIIDVMTKDSSPEPNTDELNDQVIRDDNLKTQHNKPQPVVDIMVKKVVPNNSLAQDDPSVSNNQKSGFELAESLEETPIVASNPSSPCQTKRPSINLANTEPINDGDYDVETEILKQLVHSEQNSLQDSPKISEPQHENTTGEQENFIDDFDDYIDAPIRLKEPPKEKPPPPPQDNDVETTPDQMVAKLRRAESTKRIRKQTWQRRSDFLGIDPNENPDYLDVEVTKPPPDLESILRAEKFMDEQLKKGCNGLEYSPWNKTEANDSVKIVNGKTNEDDDIARTEREIIENLEREEQRKQNDISPYFDDPHERMEEERLMSELDLLQEERFRLDEVRKLHEREKRLRQHEELVRLEKEKLRREQEALMKEKDEYQKQIQQYQQKYSPAVRRKNVILLQQSGPENNQEKSIPMSRTQKTDSKSFKPLNNSKTCLSNPEARERDEVIKLSRCPGLEGQQQQNVTGKQENPQKVDNRHQQMTKNTLHAISASPKAKLTDSEKWIARRKPEATRRDPAMYNQHWLIQEAEMRRINDQQNRLRQAKSPTRHQQKPPPSQQPYYQTRPDALALDSHHKSRHVTKTPEDIVARNIHDRTDYSELGVVPIPPKTYSTPSPLSPGASSGESQMLSVSGKKKCSHCAEELGRGAAMIIESLQLYYHIHCFKCCVCHVQLGNGLSGADVRVRNQKLHCHNCYSNDEAGLKFSKV